MRIAYVECFSGISGDMFLGALVDAGVPLRVLEEAVAALGVGAELRVSRVDRSGITATKVDVIVEGESDRPRDADASTPSGKNLKSHGHEDSHEYQHSHTHEHSHDPHHAREHSHEHAHPHTGSHPHGRHLSEIKRIIAAAQISTPAKRTATAIFEALGAAEAKVHNLDIEHVHFHEVGAVDAMVDIVGAAVGAEALGVDEIVCSPLNVGGGTVKCAHGVFPVPAPATVELLKEAPVYSSGVQAELVTPTGAAIVKTLAVRFEAFPALKIEKSGYGAGTRDFAGYPNVVRITIGETVSKNTALMRGVLMNGKSISPDAGDAASRVSTENPAHTNAPLASLANDSSALETVSVLEANLDDLNPQVIGYVMDKLLAQGALDVFGVPVQMKKNRPGTVLTVLCKPEDAPGLTQILFAETTTLGVRRRDEQRQVQARRWESVSTQWGDVRIKIASLNGMDTNFAPEYEDCRRIAEEKNVPLKTVMLEALQAYTLGPATKKR